MDNDQRQVVEKISQGMMQNIVKLPALQLKTACKEGDSEKLAEAINLLFNLENKTKLKCKDTNIRLARGK